MQVLSTMLRSLLAEPFAVSVFIVLFFLWVDNRRRWSETRKRLAKIEADIAFLLHQRELPF